MPINFTNNKLLQHVQVPTEIKQNMTSKEKLTPRFNNAGPYGVDKLTQIYLIKE